MEPERNLLKPSKEKYVETTYSPSCKKRFFLELKYLHKLSPSPFSGDSDASMMGDFGLSQWGQESCSSSWQLCQYLDLLPRGCRGWIPVPQQQIPSLAPGRAFRASWLMRGKMCESNTQEKDFHEGLYISLRTRFPCSSEQGGCGRGATAPGLSSCPQIHPIPLAGLTQQTSTVISRPLPAQEKLTQFSLSSSLPKMCLVFVPRAGAV